MKDVIRLARQARAPPATNFFWFALSHWLESPLVFVFFGMLMALKSICVTASSNAGRLSVVNGERWGTSSC